MADLSSVTDNYFTIASETFTDNLSASIAALAVSVPVNNNSEYTNGDSVVITVDPGTVNEATFIGEKSGLNFINCIWTEGNTGVGHSSGATIIDYDSATHHNAQTKGIKQFANDDGTLIAQPIRDALGLSAASTNGWEVFPYTFTVSSGYSQGNNSYELTVANQNITTLLSPGMRLRLERSTTAPTQCADLESASSQHASKATPTGITFTTTLTCSAWIKLESNYTRVIAARKQGGGAFVGWEFYINTIGKVILRAGNTASNLDDITSHQSIPLGRWVHVAAAFTMSTSGSSKIYIDGVEVSSTFTNGTSTTITQSGDLALGANSSGTLNPFDGKLSDVRVWNTIRTQTEIRDNKDQQLTGSESGLVAYYKLNGDFNDSTSNANHLTASGGALATDLDNPMKNTQYAIVTKVDYSAPNSTITVFTGTDHIIPNMTLTSPFYSSQSVPFGFPRDSGKWTIESLSDRNTDVPVNTKVLGLDLSIPVGAWIISAQVSANVTRTGGGGVNSSLGVSTSPTSVTEKWSSGYDEGGASGQPFKCSLAPTKPVTVNLTAQTIYYAVVGGVFTTCTLKAVSDGGGHRFRAECAYL